MKTVTLVGQAEEAFRYLARRLKSVKVQRIPHFEDVSPEHLQTDIAILRLSDEFSDGFTRVARGLQDRQIPFIVLSSVETMKAAVTSMHLGAFDYYLDQDDRDELIDAVLRRLESRRAVRAGVADDELEAEDIIVGTSQKIQEIFKLIGKIAASNVSVLLRGESGTGKELVARQIHANSARRGNNFVVIDCAAIPRDLVENELFGHEAGAYSGAGNKIVGKFDLAHQGTLFLDEITGLDVDLQSKILRVIQEGTFDRVGGNASIHVDVRTIATTQADLEGYVREARFRQDLYHRLNVITLFLPALRERREDIPPLVQHFVRKHSRSLGLPLKEVSTDLMTRLERYHWPGNVRELENLVKRGLLLERGPIITPRFLEEFPVPGEGPVDEEETAMQRLIADHFLTDELNWKKGEVHAQMTAKLECVLLKLVLAETHGNQVSASRLLGISRNTLRVKMAGLGLDSATFR